MLTFTEEYDERDIEIGRLPSIEEIESEMEMKEKEL